MSSSGIDQNVQRLAEIIEAIAKLRERRDETPPGNERNALEDWIDQLSLEERRLMSSGQSLSLDRGVVQATA